ncbi:hypothetical protein NBRC116602_23560 [Hyphomicrobiales bacterium 4NK60-0047b]
MSAAPAGLISAAPVRAVATAPARIAAEIADFDIDVSFFDLNCKLKKLQFPHFIRNMSKLKKEFEKFIKHIVTRL